MTSPLYRTASVILIFSSASIFILSTIPGLSDYFWLFAAIDLIATIFYGFEHVVRLMKGSLMRDDIVMQIADFGAWTSLLITLFVDGGLNNGNFANLYMA